MVCDLSAPHHIDFAGARILHGLHREIDTRGIALRIIGVRDLLRADGMDMKVGALDRVVSLDSLLAGDENQPRPNGI